MMQRFTVILLLLISSIQCTTAESNNLREGTSNYAASSQQQRELGLSNWVNLLFYKVNSSNHNKHSGSSMGGGSSSGSGSSGGGGPSGGDDVDGGDEGDESYIDSNEMEAESEWETENSENNGDGMGDVTVNGASNAARVVLSTLMIFVAGMAVASLALTKRRPNSEAIRKQEEDEIGTPAYIEISNVQTGVIKFGNDEIPESHIVARVLYNA